MVTVVIWIITFQTELMVDKYSKNVVSQLKPIKVMKNGLRL